MRGILGFAGAILLFGGFTTFAAGAPLEMTASESAVPGVVLGAVPSASSETQATFEIAPASCGLQFAIDPQNGQVSLANALDFEQQSRHEFTVRIRRSRELSGARRAYLADLVASGVEPVVLEELLFETIEQDVVVHVTDTPEAPALASNPLTLVVRDPAGDATSTLELSDPDSDDSHSFELIAGDQERFQIDSETGVLTWRSGATEGGAYPLTVRVTDADGLSDAVTLNVEVVMPVTVVSPGVPAPAEVPAVTELPAPPPADDDDLVASSSPLAEPQPGSSIELGNSPVTEPIDAEPAAPVEVAETESVPFEEVPAEIDEPSAPQAAEINSDIALAAEVPAALPTEGAGGVTPTHLVLLLLPLFMAAGATVVLVMLRRRKRLAVISESAPNAFRIVREARMLAPTQVPAQDATGNGQNPQAPELPAVVAQHAEKAAVHQMMAAAFEQSSIPFAPPPPPPVSVPVVVEPRPEVRHVTPLEMLEEVYRAPEIAEVSAPAVLDSLEIIEEPIDTVDRADEIPIAEVTAINPVDDEPVLATQTIDMAMLRREAIEADEPPTSSVPFNELIAAPTSAWGNQDAGEPAPDFDTEPFARPHLDIDHEGVVENPTAESAPQWQIAEHHSTEEMAGYSTPDDELGGYHQIRLSATAFAPTPDEIAAAEPQPASEYGNDTLNFVPSPAAHSHGSEPEDAKLQELRRQLSDLFGVSADRPATPMYVDERADDFAPQQIDQPEPSPYEPEPVAAAPVAPIPEPEPVADPSDPVNTWLAYLKQRAEGQQSAPKAVAAPAPVIAPPPAAPRPIAPPPVPVPAAPAAMTQSPQVRVNKTAVREEITLLRNVANLHSRNVLARRASHQRARFAWVLWGTALVVLCFGGLAALRQGPGLMRTVSLVLFAGAAVALGGCAHAFRSLNNRTDGTDEEQDEVPVVEDFERTLAPELMTPEMEARLRSVMTEAPEVPVAAGEARS